MKSGQSGPGAGSRAPIILQTLAEKLPDRLLREYFAEFAPAEVRKTLTESAAILGPPEEKTTPARRQATLWRTEEKAWKGKLRDTTLHLYTDGASRGNPGQAGAGISILDEQGNELAAACEYLGRCTNNEAEYGALLAGLAKCGEFGRGRLKVHLDSELVVKQILGQYRVKHPNLKPLHQKTMQRLADFAAYSIVHVRREKNSRADELANRAIDEQSYK